MILRRGRVSRRSRWRCGEALLALDFRLKPEVMAELRGSYPQGPVPGVTLGARDGANASEQRL